MNGWMEGEIDGLMTRKWIWFQRSRFYLIESKYNWTLNIYNTFWLNCKKIKTNKLFFYVKENIEKSALVSFCVVCLKVWRDFVGFFTVLYLLLLIGIKWNGLSMHLQLPRIFILCTHVYFHSAQVWPAIIPWRLYTKQTKCTFWGASFVCAIDRICI